jgi:hypothetical protein
MIIGGEEMNNKMHPVEWWIVFIMWSITIIFGTGFYLNDNLQKASFNDVSDNASFFTTGIDGVNYSVEDLSINKDFTVDQEYFGEIKWAESPMTYGVDKIIILAITDEVTSTYTFGEGGLSFDYVDRLQFNIKNETWVYVKEGIEG